MIIYTAVRGLRGYKKNPNLHKSTELCYYVNVQYYAFAQLDATKLYTLGLYSEMGVGRHLMLWRKLAILNQIERT